jgi:ligand-binding SRPBCC domain-containing protein
MGVHRVEAYQPLPITVDEAWAYFSDPRNLADITPSWLGFELLSEIPDTMHPGLVMTHRVRPLLGLPMTWVTEITQVVERALFVDEQRRGPYALWHHQHHFTEIPGGVEIGDIVHYALPLGPIGDLIDRLTIADQVAEIFEFRRRTLAERFGTMLDPRRGES